MAEKTNLDRETYGWWGDVSQKKAIKFMIERVENTFQLIITARNFITCRMQRATEIE